MGIVMTTNMGDLDDYLQEQINRRIKAIIATLARIGTECQNEAKDNKGYKDVTGNLKSSVGYVILNDGVVVSGDNFTQDGNGSAGIAEGKSALNSEISKHPTGIVLIVVAGMNYAAAVEARNLNVLTSAELLAEKLVPQLMKQLGF